MALYPTLAVLVGTMDGGKHAWRLVAHVGTIGHDEIMLSMFNKHFANQWVKATGKVSVNIIGEALL